MCCSASSQVCLSAPERPAHDLQLSLTSHFLLGNIFVHPRPLANTSETSKKPV